VIGTEPEATVSSLFELLMLWMLLGVAVVMVVLAARARRLEREEGLASSQKRLVAVSLIGAAIAALVLGATVLPLLPRGGPSPARRPAPAATPDPLAAAKRDDLKKKKAALYEQLDRINAEMAKLVPPETTPAAAEAPSPWYAVDLAPLAHFLVPLLVIVGTFCLVTLGDPATLLRSGLFARDRDGGAEQGRAVFALDRLSHLADSGQFREGLGAAAAVDVGALDRFDRLDWAFLKNYCAVQLAAAGETEERVRVELLDAAARDLDTLLEQAPNRGEAVYLLAVAHALLGERRKGFDGFERARPLLAAQAAGLPFDHNESVCLLGLAEERLGQGDAEEAGRLFDQVTRRGVLVDQIPTSLVKVRLLNVRQSLQAGELDAASQGIEAVRSLEGLDAEQKQSIDAICDAMETLIAVRRGDAPQVLQCIETFLARHLPPGLPEPDEEIADEYLDSPVAGLKLALGPPIFRAFLFLKAEALSKIAAKDGTAPSEARVGELARPLFRALQFELRQRDILAALGGLYYWFLPDKRAKALEWLEAAAALGAEGRIARRLLEQARASDQENRQAMEWFRSTSLRFLHDPTVAAQVRQALVEELGRFKEFQPLLLDLASTPELEPREPTLRLLRERAGYLETMMADLAARKSGAVGPHLHELRKDYQRLIAGIDASTGQLAEVERKIVQEIGKIVIS
jgi:hypothetical protein